MKGNLNIGVTNMQWMPVLDELVAFKSSNYARHSIQILFMQTRLIR
jgi:hypothetical protein